MNIFLFILAGIAGGILGGMGLGGGTLLMPALTLFLDVPHIKAAAINLIAFVPMSIVSCIIHAKNKLIDWKSALLLAIPATVTGTMFSLFAQKLQSETLSRAFGIFLIVLSSLMIISNAFNFIKTKLKKSG